MEILNGRIVKSNDDKILVEYKSGLSASGGALFSIQEEQFEKLEREDWEKYLGQEIDFEVIEILGSVLSRRAKIVKGIQFEKSFVGIRKKNLYKLYINGYGGYTVSAEDMEIDSRGFYHFYNTGNNPTQPLQFGTSMYLPIKETVGMFPIQNTSIYEIKEEI